MQIQTEERGCFTLQGHSSVALHAVRFKAMRRNWSSDHQASPAMALWITHSDKRPRTQGHLHSTTNPLRAVYMRCVRAHVRVSAFSLINGLYYSELLNFISSGSLWGIEQALSPSACMRVFTFPQSATLTYLQVNMLYGCIFVVQAPCWVAKLQRERVGIRAPPFIQTERW